MDADGFCGEQIYSIWLGVIGQTGSYDFLAREKALKVVAGWFGCFVIMSSLSTLCQTCCGPQTINRVPRAKDFSLCNLPIQNQNAN